MLLLGLALICMIRGFIVFSARLVLTSHNRLFNSQFILFFFQRICLVMMTEVSESLRWTHQQL